MRTTDRVLIATTLLAIAAQLRGETPPAPAPIAIHRRTGPIVIDGSLADAGWNDTATIDRFYETQPGDNTPPKVKTVAYLDLRRQIFLHRSALRRLPPFVSSGRPAVSNCSRPNDAG